ncbi:MAG TPA: hypothetical protein PLW09_12565 [Candidatus Kapabacteria bacterium]|jgi:hypothetical protein|nr:hypothetical protein [Candidatus Kapabacteria bacterium]
MVHIEFNKIYFDVDADGYLKLFFVDLINEKILFFDGINFYYQQTYDAVENLSVLNYNKSLLNLHIKKITQDFGISYIQISNGDVFQIYSMGNNEKLEQILAIFDETETNILAPLGISVYEAAVKRSTEADKAEIFYS